MNKGIVYKDTAGQAVLNTQNCAGCRTCELACSYHHRRVFSPGISSIEITDNPKGQGCMIEFYKDGCAREEEPLCLKYCSILMRDQLKDFLQKDLLPELSKE